MDPIPAYSVPMQQPCNGPFNMMLLPPPPPPPLPHFVMPPGQFMPTKHWNWDLTGQPDSSSHNQQHVGRFKPQWKNKTNKFKHGGQKRKMKEDNFIDFCDVCDRGFKSEEKKQEHYQQHAKCKEPGCKFEAHFKIVEQHQRNAHGPNRLKPEMLQDVEKWRAERRKNYPTASRVQEKQMQLEERVESGAVLARHHFGKFNKRQKRGGHNNNRQNRTNQPHNSGSNNNHPTQSTSSRDEVSEPTTNPMDLLAGNLNSHADSDSADEVASEAPSQPVQASGKAASGLASLMASYTCSSDSDHEHGDASAVEIPTNISPNSTDNCVNPMDRLRESSQNDLTVSSRLDSTVNPEESSTLSLEPEDPPIAEDKTDSNHEKQSEPSKHGDQHFASQETRPTTLHWRKNTTYPTAHKRQRRRNNKIDFANRPTVLQRHSLLKMLLEPDIRRERNDILQCARFIVRNNFFQQES